MAAGALEKAGFKEIYTLGADRRVEEGRPAGGEVRWPPLSRRSRCARRRPRPFASAPSVFGARGVTAIAKIRVDLDPSERIAMMQRTGRRTVPQIYVGDVRGRLRGSGRARPRRRPAPMLAGTIA
jgi:hypothetical protein